jgi:hypothetical protein
VGAVPDEELAPAAADSGANVSPPPRGPSHNRSSQDSVEVSAGLARSLDGGRVPGSDFDHNDGQSGDLVAKPATSRRWREAQRAEREFWEGVPQHPATVASILASAAGLGAWAHAKLGGALPAGPWVDIGIGPLGIGCGQFVRLAASTEVVGVDPLELAELDGGIPAPLQAAVERCRCPKEAVRPPDRAADERPASPRP